MNNNNNKKHRQEESQEGGGATLCRFARRRLGSQSFHVEKNTDDAQREAAAGRCSHALMLVFVCVFSNVCTSTK